MSVQDEMCTGEEVSIQDEMCTGEEAYDSLNQ